MKIATLLFFTISILNNQLSFAQVMPQGFLVGPDVETITIGAQVWMKKNLDLTVYQDGSSIEGADVAFNRNLFTPAWCYYDHNIINNATYGKLYNGYAVNDTRNICPVGFRVPTLAVFNKFAVSIGGNTNGGRLKEAGTVNWASPNTSATNSTNFTALPGGYMGNANSSSNMFSQAYFWTLTPITGGGSTNYIRFLMSTNGTFSESTAFVLEGGASVRCIKQ